MIDITHKFSTLRQATAQAIVRVGKAETITAIKNRTVPKGDVFEMAKTAALFAVKRTSDIIPDCHPLPIEYASISYSIQDLQIFINLEVKTVYKTGVEVEAMHGASVAALTIYDMLKPLDKEITIAEIKLIEKRGGKSDLSNRNPGNTRSLKAAVIVISDSVGNNKSEDRSGLYLIDKLKQYGISDINRLIVIDDVYEIQNSIKQSSSSGFDLILTTGGTGVSGRDVTPEAVRPLMDFEIPGIMEASRSYGQNRTPFAMLSRGVAGFIGNTLVITLPGSLNAVKESMDALFPHVLHVFKVKEGKRHEE